MTHKFTIESLDGLDLRSFDLSYYTLCCIADSIRKAAVTAESIQSWMKSNQFTTCELTLDDLGNFISMQGA